MQTSRTPFHLAFPSHDLRLCREFYEKLGAVPGRANANALILNLAGNQIVAHLVRETPPAQESIYPRHFGLIYPNLAEWEKCLERARQHQLPFFREPVIRYENSPLEHRSFFLRDPSNNLLEFKYYSRPEAVFGEQAISQVGETNPA